MDDYVKRFLRMRRTLERFFDKAPRTDQWGDTVIDQVRRSQIGVFCDVTDTLSGELKGGGRIIGRHESKSMILPVVKFTLRSGASCTIRNNFADNAVSITGSRPLSKDVLDAVLADVQDDGSRLYQGFPKKEVHRSFVENAGTFSTHLPSYNDYLAVLMRHFRLVNAIGSPKQTG
ncbi:MAG: hypothetical protein P4M13_04845 [Alphaproteobacteria bacterium]|nr:hypothetical protein [Alphaproteobacteria bacterium]